MARLISGCRIDVASLVRHGAEGGPPGPVASARLPQPLFRLRIEEQRRSRVEVDGDSSI